MKARSMKELHTQQKYPDRYFDYIIMFKTWKTHTTKYSINSIRMKMIWRDKQRGLKFALLALKNILFICKVLILLKKFLFRTARPTSLHKAIVRSLKVTAVADKRK